MTIYGQFDRAKQFWIKLDFVKDSTVWQYAYKAHWVRLCGRPSIYIIKREIRIPEWFPHGLRLGGLTALTRSMDQNNW